MKIETDNAEIYTGVRHGKSLGAPIGLILPNKDFKNWKTKMSSEVANEEIKKITLSRPGHADLAGVQKFDFDDIRNVLERSSARETAMRVALASVCRKLLKDLGIEGLCHISNFPNNDYYFFDEISKSLVGRNSGQGYFLGNSVSVKIKNVEVSSHRIDLEITK